jgi:hypothetical protein
MADDSPKTAPSDSKTPEQTKAQQDAKTTAEATAKAGAVQLSHGEPSDSQKEQQEQAEKAAKDPWGDTPLQMRDTHSPEVDPEQNDPLKNSTSAVGRSTAVNPMEPGESAEEPPKGGTNAPA